MRVIPILLCLFLIGCITTEELQRIRKANIEYYSSKEYRESGRERECQRLREKIARGTDKDAITNLFDMFSPIPQGNYGVNTSVMLMNEREREYQYRLTLYKTAVESYRTLCR